ncbi:hypothetical protein JW948_12245 [bacterium]|nr:hypothetical protein [bacterium]
MKKLAAIVIIICVVISMALISGCQKPQAEKAPAEAIGAAADTTAAAMDSTAAMEAEPEMEMAE